MKLDSQGLQWFALRARLAALGVALVASTSISAEAQSRAEISVADPSAAPENLTSTLQGTVYFGSTEKGTIYRALPDKTQAEAWIQGEKASLTNVLGLLADEKSNTLWVCDNAPFGRGEPPVGLPSLRTFDLKSGEAKGTYPSPNGGVLNDVAIAPDGTAYVSDTFGGRILCLKPGAETLDVWLADPQLRGVDGLSLLADGALYVNNFFNGKLLRIPVKEDGMAGSIVELQTSVAFSRPDGLRASGPKSLLQVEGQGRLTEITIDGDRADVRVIKEGLTRAAGVTQVGESALVLVDRRRAVVVPMSPRERSEAAVPKKP